MLPVLTGDRLYCPSKLRRLRATVNTMAFRNSCSVRLAALACLAFLSTAPVARGTGCVGVLSLSITPHFESDVLPHLGQRFVDTANPPTLRTCSVPSARPPAFSLFGAVVVHGFCNSRRPRCGLWWHHMWFCCTNQFKVPLSTEAVRRCSRQQQVNGGGLCSTDGRQRRGQRRSRWYVYFAQ